MRKIALTGLLVVMAAGSACAQTASSQNGTAETDPEVVKASETITEADYLSRISVIAHDSMGGRDTPSAGLDLTAAWIASEFQRFGLEPGGDDGTFLQRYPIQRVRPDYASSGIEVSGGGTLRFGEDVLVGRTPVEGDFPGGVVLAGGRIDETAIGEGVRGSHVFYVAPPGQSFRATRSAARFLREAGAASVLSVSGLSQARWENSARRSGSRVSQRIGSSGGAPSFTVRRSAIESLLQANGASLDQARDASTMTLQPVRDLEITLSPRLEVLEEETAPNVVGILEGSDPELRDEYLVYSAHMDHVGITTPDAAGDSIRNGADDDASGTTAVVELAEAFSSMPSAPRRSIIFLLVSGEEKGMWGSRHFVDNPPVPIDQIVAGLNADMIGRNWTDKIVVIGKDHSDLGETLEEVNGRHPELGMEPIDDLWPEENFYGRSDHINFARAGVPILFFFNGTHDDYHGRDDEVDRIDSEKAARITKLMFFLGAEIAGRTERPRWDPQSRRRIVL